MSELINSFNACLFRIWEFLLCVFILVVTAKGKGSANGNCNGS